MAEELDFKYKIDVVQEGEPNTNGEMIIIYNYDGAELTPELLAKTLEELSTQASLNRSGLGESILLDESGKIIHQDASDANIVKVESETNGSLLGLEQSEICTGDFGNSSALLATAESWENLKEEHNIQLEVIAQDATSGASIGSSYLTPLIDNGSLPQSETNKSARDDYTCVVNVNTFSDHNDTNTSQYKAKYENSGPLDHNISDKTDSNKQLQCVDPKHDASVLKKEISKIEYHCKECTFTAFAEIELQRHQKMEHHILEPFVCQYCLKAFKLELTLDIHKLSHTTQVDAPKINLKHIHKVSKFFSCPICDFQYQRKPQLMVHMASTHHGDKYFFCNDCNYSCLTEEKLLDHTQTTSHKDEQRTLCPLCGASTKNLRQHVRTAHNENRPFLCTTCGFKAKTATNLKTHMHIHDPIKQIHCSQCSYKCRTKDQLKKHMVRHSSEKKFKCGLCSFACKTSMSLKRHMQIHQAPGKYICNICRFSTHDKLILKDHKKTQHKLKPRYICRECSLEFERPLELRKHALSVHKSDKTQFCSYCDFSCNTTTQLRTHLEQHFGKFSYACHICGYSSRIKASYRRHMERHNKVKNYKCEHCDYACVEKYDLQKHIAHRHSEEKPYSCPYCSYSCKFKPRLNNHISFIHSDEKPFFCKECSYAGKSAESLKKHMVHHGVLPVSSKAIQCVLCDYATHERAKLRRHMKGHVNKAFIEIQTVE
ncbi:Zinc finger protein 99-like [Plakobranchus ocellatus]|uniref:Zinc finger protein 99-like n=1 Tax=Plakobranchus ocellatus TaxID=259542 RepID=A0AAV4BYG5_9GAST|nr:Zinc finger protein 99-like [Plakobranchus ocellatus]